MDKEVLAVYIMLVLLVGINLWGFSQAFDFSPQATDDEMELYWQGCNNDDIKGFEYQVDCELHQALVDANLMGDVNSSD